MNKYDSLIFDLDGTLCDTLPNIMYSVNYALEKYNLPTHNIEEFKTYVGNGSIKLIERSIYPKNEMFQKVFDLYMKIYLEDPIRYTKPYKGIKELLIKAKEKNIKLFVYTNKPQSLAIKVIYKCFDNLFDKVVGITNKDEKIKPEPDLFINNTKEFNIDYHSSAYFGDSDVDILTGFNLKVREIYSVCWGYQTYNYLRTLKKQPTKYLKDINDFISFI